MVAQAVDKAFALAATNYPMDPNRLYTVGYSAGCRGMFRLNGRFPNVSEYHFQSSANAVD